LCEYHGARIKQRKNNLFVFSALLHPLVANTSKACTCHTERRKTKREGRGKVIIAELAHGEVEGGAKYNDSCKCGLVSYPCSMVYLQYITPSHD